MKIFINLLLINKKFISVIILLIIIPSYCYGSRFEKKIELPPIKLTYHDLNIIFNALRNQLPKDDNLVNSDNIEQYVEVGNNNITIGKEGAFLFGKDEQLPDIAYKLSYRYNIMRNVISNLKIIEFDFSDYKREIRVVGNSQDHVDAMAVFLDNKFKIYEITMGGSKFRAYCFFIYIISLIFIVIYFISRSKLSDRIKALIIIVGAIIYSISIISIVTL